jgi:hypothetical protein
MKGDATTKTGGNGDEEEGEWDQRRGGRTMALRGAT